MGDARFLISDGCQSSVPETLSSFAFRCVFFGFGMPRQLVAGDFESPGVTTSAPGQLAGNTALSPALAEGDPILWCIRRSGGPVWGAIETPYFVGGTASDKHSIPTLFVNSFFGWNTPYKKRPHTPKGDDVWSVEARGVGTPAKH